MIRSKRTLRHSCFIVARSELCLDHFALRLNLETPCAELLAFVLLTS